MKQTYGPVRRYVHACIGNSESGNAYKRPRKSCMDARKGLFVSDVQITIEIECQVSSAEAFYDNFGLPDIFGFWDGIVPSNLRFSAALCICVAWNLDDRFRSAPSRPVGH